MRIITLNANGIRAAARKGFFDWLRDQHADVVCVQETKARREQLERDATFFPDGYHAYFHDAQKPGYSGVAIYSRQTPDRVVAGLGWPDFDTEGRYLQIDVGRLSVVSLYLPSGSSSDARQAAKFDFMARFKEVLRRARRRRREFIICGDWNIAHKKIDLRNWRSNQKNSGFLPAEREWMEWMFSDCGYVDAFREVCADAEQYTWWSNRGQAWAKNVGWRLDYQVVTPGLRDTVRAAAIYKDQRFSDHAPLVMDYELEHLCPI